MNWEAIGAIGEILGAAAVLITLIYLSLQVRQARISQNIAAIRNNRTERRDFFTSFRDSPYMPQIVEKARNGEVLSEEDKIRMFSHNASLFGLIYSEWIQRRLDLSGEFRTSQDTNLYFAFSQPGSTEWFEEYGKRLYHKDFVREVSAAKANLSDLFEDAP